MDDDLTNKCIFCTNASTESKPLRAFKPETFTKAKVAASRRSECKANVFHKSTVKILNIQEGINHYYHSHCYSNFTALKRPVEVAEGDAPPQKRQRRSGSRKDRNILDEKCIFCEKERYKLKGSWQKLSKVATPTCEATIVDMSKCIDNPCLSSIVNTGNDLRAREAWYHRSCYLDAYNKVAKINKKVELVADEKKSAHEDAFQAVKDIVQIKVVQSREPVRFPMLLEVYNKRLCKNGFTELQSRHVPKDITKTLIFIHSDPRCITGIIFSLYEFQLFLAVGTPPLWRAPVTPCPKRYY